MITDAEKAARKLEMTPDKDKTLEELTRGYDFNNWEFAGNLTDSEFQKWMSGQTHAPGAIIDTSSIVGAMLPFKRGWDKRA